MAYWKWIASWQTINECLIRRLFGHYREETEGGNKLNMTEGDTLFLHHTTGPEEQTGKLLGPLLAASDAKSNIVEGAWKHKGGYHWQVEVEWKEAVCLIDVEEEFDDDDSAVNLTAYAQSLSEVQGLWLEGKINDGRVIISPR